MVILDIPLVDKENNMSFEKLDIMSRLSRCHDEIKAHPFRVSFEQKYIKDYKNLLYQLTEIWADLIWRCDEIPEFEQHRLRMFGEWIHDFRQYLRMWDGATFPMQFFDYYEQMLQVTHIYIESGDYSTYYNLNCYFNNKGRYAKSTKYVWITEEKCGIKSSILPRYLPVGITFITDDDVAREYFSTGWYASRGKQEADTDFEFWQNNTKPVLEWLNNWKGADKETLQRCMITTPSRCK